MKRPIREVVEAFLDKFGIKPGNYLHHHGLPTYHEEWYCGSCERSSLVSESGTDRVQGNPLYRPEQPGIYRVGGEAAPSLCEQCDRIAHVILGDDRSA